jgi:serine/threonine protein kinase/WD40 repeat protein
VKGGFSHDEAPAGSKSGPGDTLHIVIPEEAAFLHGAPKRLGSYELLEVIAHGGMGVVYKARHAGLDRIVALKMIRSGVLATPRDVERFQREARSAAKLHHPNIVAIHDIGEQEGQHYYTMDHVPGENLSERARTQPFSPRQAAEITAAVAAAIHYAHQSGVLHRDIKPANVILTPEQQPRVLDFGLALILADDSALTLTGTPVGSPPYMPPEQAAGQTGRIDARSDVYGLGALLYELLTGHPPFRAASTMETLRLVIENEVVPPRRLNPALPSDLETLCLKCLEKDPNRRYQTAQELKEELGRFIRDEPILARPVSQVEKVRRWCRRKPLVASLSATTFILLLSVAVGSPIALYHINQERKRAEASLQKEAASRQRAERAEGEMEQQLHAALLEQGRATILSGEMGQRFRALDAVRRASAISNSVELRGVAIAALALPDLRFERELAVPPNVFVAKLDPAFERIALGAGNGPVEIRAVSDNRLLVTLPAATNRAISSLGQWSRDGRFFAVERGYESGRSMDMEVWNVASATRVLLVHASSPSAFSFHPRWPRIVVGRAPAAAVTWDLESGQEITSQPLEGRPRLLKFAPDGEAIAAVHDVGQQSKVTIHSSQDGVSGTSRLFTNRVHEITWHPGGDSLAVGDDKGRVHVMNAQTGETHLLGRHKSDVTVLEFTPDGQYLFSGGWDQEVICWNVNAMRRAFAVLLKSYHVQFRADGRQCAIRRANPETRVQLYEFERPALHREFAEDLGGPRGSAAFSRDGRWLAACGDERLVVWDLNRDGPGAVMQGIPDTRVSFAANGELFVNPRGGCSRWRPAPGTNAAGPPELKPLDLAKPAGMFSFCVVSNGLVLTGTNGSRWAVLDRLADEGSRWAPTISGLNGVSPDERWLALFRPFGTDLYIHRLPALEPVTRLTNEYRIDQFEFSPLGDEVAVGNWKGVEFWSTTTWQRTRHLTNFTDVLYSPDARTLWLSTKFQAASLHDARTADLILPMPPNTRPRALSPDGRHLAVTVNAHRVQVWDLAEVRLRLRELGLDWASNR